jgi:hypothetical protein
VVYTYNLRYSGGGGRKITVPGKKCMMLSEKQTKEAKEVGCVSVVEHLPCKHEALVSILQYCQNKQINKI